MKGTEVVDEECPDEVVDTLLWRNAQITLQRHVPRLDGTCRWCGRPSPCAAVAVAYRAQEVSRLPLHEAWAARNEMTRLLPVLTMAAMPDRRELSGGGRFAPVPPARGHFGNERGFG